MSIQVGRQRPRRLAVVDDDRPARMTASERWALALLSIGTASFLPLALNRFVFPKLAVIAAGVLIATLTPARGRLPAAAVTLLVASAGWLVVAALTGAMPLEQLIGLPPRYEGIVSLPVYAGAGIAGARLLGPARARGSSAWFLRWLSVAAIAIGVEAVLEAAGLRPLASNVQRPGSLLGNASDEGAWAILALAPLAAVSLRVGGRLYLAGAVGAAANSSARDRAVRSLARSQRRRSCCFYYHTACYASSGLRVRSR
jgi:hypothetical protein